LKHCTAHGLRKAGATIAANNGATATQIMAIFGWTDINQAELYTRNADQKKLARDGMPLIAKRDDDRRDVSHSGDDEYSVGPKWLENLAFSMTGKGGRIPMGARIRPFGH
jgi:hypothetical protein